MGNFDIRRADVQAWVSGKGKAARTVDTIYGRFRSFLNWCVEEGRVVASPAKGVNLPKGVKRERIYLTIPEVERLAGAIHRQRLRVARSITDVGGPLRRLGEVRPAHAWPRLREDHPRRLRRPVRPGTLRRGWPPAWTPSSVRLRN